MKDGYSVGISRDISDFISLIVIDHLLRKPSWKRKEAILIVKIATWMRTTQTGLLDEMKYYGDERMMIDLLRARDEEENPFFMRHRSNLEKNTILIADLMADHLEECPLLRETHSLIIRDIVSIEDIVRRKRSRSISFETLFSLCASLRDLCQESV